ncbi:MAG: hypothetical protein KBC91_02510 [Candidatus Omnitrophica bacterium]|nr:hypothetical protein [Candidatus Omnitrophota bacterium]
MALILGIPKEIKTLEKRVGLTPEGLHQLTQQGIQVYVEKGAGEASGFSNAAYEQAGALFANSAAELYECSQIIQKIKEPLPSEFAYFHPGLILFSFLHLAAPSSCDLVKALRDNKVTALAFETLEKDGQRPLLTPMSEIAGALSSLFAGYYLKLELLKPGGSGNACQAPFSRFSIREDLEKIGGAYPEILPGMCSAAHTVIFGGGIAGASAAHYALRLGGDVTVIEKSRPRSEQLSEMFKSAGSRFQVGQLECLPTALFRAAEIWIGAVHQTGKRAVQVVDKTFMETMCRENPKIIMDISIDQGGNFPEALPTSYEDPIYRDSWGNVRFCVPNIPSLAGRFASERLTSLVLPYTHALAEGYEQAVQCYPELTSSANVMDGRILLDCVRAAHGL